MKKGIWIRNKIVPYYLKGAKFALAMLLTEKNIVGIPDCNGHFGKRDKM